MSTFNQAFGSSLKLANFSCCIFKLIWSFARNARNTPEELLAAANWRENHFNRLTGSRKLSFDFLNPKSVQSRIFCRKNPSSLGSGPSADTSMQIVVSFLLRGPEKHDFDSSREIPILEPDQPPWLAAKEQITTTAGFRLLHFWLYRRFLLSYGNLAIIKTVTDRKLMGKR